MKRISIIIISILVMSALFSSCSEKDAAVITTQKQSTSSVSETISAKPKSTTDNHVETKPKTTATTSTTAVSKAVTTHISPSTTKKHTTTTQKSQSKARSTSERKQPHLNLIVLITIITVLLVVIWEDGLAVEVMSKNIGNRLMQSIFLNMKKEK